MSELDAFIATWDHEAQNSAKLLRALPAGQYDFRPDPGGRSLGELAWHLAEIAGVMSFGIAEGKFTMGVKRPSLERPRAIAELAPGYDRVHREAVTRLRAVDLPDLGRTITFFNGRDMPIRMILWAATLHHEIHHRGQLTLMCRLAGGVPPSMYGPGREDMARMMAERAKG